MIDENEYFGELDANLGLLVFLLRRLGGKIVSREDSDSLVKFVKFIAKQADGMEEELEDLKETLAEGKMIKVESAPDVEDPLYLAERLREEIELVERGLIAACVESPKLFSQNYTLLVENLKSKLDGLKNSVEILEGKISE